MEEMKIYDIIGEEMMCLKRMSFITTVCTATKSERVCEQRRNQRRAIVERPTLRSRSMSTKRPFGEKGEDDVN
jgi:hypothetical protein